MVVLSVDHVGTSMHNITLHKVAASLRASRSCNYCNCIVLQKQPYHYPSYNISCSHQRNYMSYDTVSTTNEYDVPTIKAENQGYVPPLVRLQSAVIQYPSVSGDHIDGIGLHDDNNVDGNNKHIMHQQNSRRHWNNKQQSTIQNYTSWQFVKPFNLNIWPNIECGSGGGGHVILGRNASGKTLLSRTLVQSLGNIRSAYQDNDEGTARNNEYSNTNPFLQSGDISMNRRNASQNRNHHFLSHVSFDSHSDLLLNPHTTTVHKALIPSGGNRLSPTAKFLSVRLGMYPLLPRFVNTLSTGEIRRVLLVRALVSKPELLILDNAFDGLDVQGRQGLQDIIERILAGFRMDILVQGISAKDTARTQVLLLTHRPEEISDGFGMVTFMDRRGGNGVRTERRMGRNGQELVRSLMSAEDDRWDEETATSHPWDVVSSSDLPNDDDISSFWDHERKIDESNKTNVHEDVLVHAQDLKVTRDDTTLINYLNWTVQRGERWHIAGSNGAGKSTLSRLLLRASMNNDLQYNNTAHKNDAIISDGYLSIEPSVALDIRLKRGGVSWVSTELHLHATHNWGNRTVLEILLVGASFLFNADRNCGQHSNIDGVLDTDVAMTALSWLCLVDNDGSDIINHPFLSRHFSTLSQGEQKLLLVASAIAQRPSLLVLDEPCQGLDLWNKGHLLGLVEKICKVTDMSLLYVTHHEEELIPSIRHRLLLDDGDVTYCGVRRDV